MLKYQLSLNAICSECDTTEVICFSESPHLGDLKRTMNNSTALAMLQEKGWAVGKHNVVTCPACVAAIQKDREKYIETEDSSHA